MAVNVDTGSYTTYDQIIKDEKIVEVELKLEGLNYEQMLAFADDLNNEIEKNNPEWFSRLVNDIQLIVPLKRSEGRNIGKELRLNLIKILFGIYNSREGYVDLLKSLFPLYDFVYDSDGPSFRNEDRAGNNARFRISVDPIFRTGFPSLDFIVLIHEITHSINASIPKSKLENLKDPVKVETYKTMNRFSGVIQFIKEYLSDVTAMLLSNKEGQDPSVFSFATESALDRIRTSIRFYPSLRDYVKTNGWESIIELASIVPNNLVIVGEISRIVTDVLTEHVNEKKINPDAVPGVSVEDEDLLLIKLVDKIKPFYKEIESIENLKDEGKPLDDYQQFLDQSGDISRTYYYSEGADTALKILNQIAA